MHFEDVLTRITDGYETDPKQWTMDGPWLAVPYIGQFFAQRMERGGFPTPRAFASQVQDWLRAAPPGVQRRERLRRIVQAACQGRRGNQCAQNSYHIREINPACFFALLAVLYILWDVVRRPRTRLPLPRDDLRAVAQVSWRLQAAATCGCFRTLARCNAQAGRCKWKAPSVRSVLPQSAGPRCIPTNPRHVGFESFPGFVGQRANSSSRGLNVRPGATYIRDNYVQWRSPTPLTLLSALGVPPGGVAAPGWPV